MATTRKTTSDLGDVANALPDAAPEMPVISTGADPIVVERRDFQDAKIVLRHGKRPKRHRQGLYSDEEEKPAKRRRKPQAKPPKPHPRTGPVPKSEPGPETERKTEAGQRIETPENPTNAEDMPVMFVEATPIRRRRRKLKIAAAAAVIAVGAGIVIWTQGGMPQSMSNAPVATVMPTNETMGQTSAATTPPLKTALELYVTSVETNCEPSKDGMIRIEVLAHVTNGSSVNGQVADLPVICAGNERVSPTMADMTLRSGTTKSVRWVADVHIDSGEFVTQFPDDVVCRGFDNVAEKLNELRAPYVPIGEGTNETSSPAETKSENKEKKRKKTEQEPALVEANETTTGTNTQTEPVTTLDGGTDANEPQEATNVQTIDDEPTPAQTTQRTKRQSLVSSDVSLSGASEESGVSSVASLGN